MSLTKEIEREVQRRRTFGIISHPDAGKTTLTEKLLLFGGAIQLAGTVKSRKADRHARSDWMKMEQERGISVTTSVMKFNYKDFEINLLDTPGHQDFSEDTYRVLTAVDSALLVIDSGRGVESQTLKLMDVCRMRDTPIMTFINKLDREGLSPLDVMADIEDRLQIECAPLTWPIGMGKNFKGTYNIYKQQVRFFEAGGERLIHQEKVCRLDDPLLNELIGDTAAGQLREELDLLEGAGNPFELERYLSGSQTPVFFGSAINNFGVQELLDNFVELAPAPRPRRTATREVSPYEEKLTGVVFKIQANMDPAHRDRIAFMRVCSGKFERGMKLRHHRIGKDITVANATIFLAQDRTGVENAYAGDIIGLHNHGTIKIGDTFTEKEELKFTGIPSFAPELFKRVILKSPLKAKQLQKGLTQLAEEGAVQLFRPLLNNDYILGAVGVLQFDVITSRLKNEYNVDAVYQPVDLSVARWIGSKNSAKLEEFKKKNQSALALDGHGDLVFLAQGQWKLDYTAEQWPQIDFFRTREQE